MNKYLCVRELIFLLFQDVSLGRLCSNSLIASKTTPQHPGVVRLHVNAFYFSTTARLVTSPTWGPQPPCKQALKNEYIFFCWNFAKEWMCLPSLTAPQVNLSITYESGVEF